MDLVLVSSSSISPISLTASLSGQTRRPCGQLVAVKRQNYQVK